MTEIKKVTRAYEKWLDANRDKLDGEVLKQAEILKYSLRALCMGRNIENRIMREDALRRVDELSRHAAPSQ